jgi:hypothetical protein
VWRTRSQRELSREDARQIVENVSGFFSILYGWSRAEFGVAANDDGDRRASHIVAVVRFAFVATRI